MHIGKANDTSPHLAVCAMIDPCNPCDMSHKLRRRNLLDVVDVLPAEPVPELSRHQRHREIVAQATNLPARRIDHVLVIEPGLQLSSDTAVFSSPECLKEDLLTFLRFADAATVLASTGQTIDVVFLGYATSQGFDASVWPRKLFYTYADKLASEATLPTPRTGRYLEWRTLRPEGQLCYLITAAAAQTWLADNKATRLPVATYLCEKFRTFSIEPSVRCR